MKRLRLLPIIVLVAFSGASFGNEAQVEPEKEQLMLEVVWGNRAEPECRLTLMVEPGAPFAVRSEDGKYNAGGVVGLPKEDECRMDCSLFTRFSQTSYTMGGPSTTKFKLGEPIEWVTVGGVARFYSVTLYRADEKDGKKAETSVEETGETNKNH